MLKEAFTQGHEEALRKFALATSWDPKASFGAQVARGIIGHPDVLWREGLNAFKNPKSGLHFNNVFWPQGASPMKWVGRAGTIMSALPVASALLGSGDPREGRLSNMLGAAGGAIGSAYGFPMGGLAGGAILGRAGTALGHGIGHLLGSKPRPAVQPQHNDPNQLVYGSPGGF